MGRQTARRLMDGAHRRSPRTQPDAKSWSTPNELPPITRAVRTRHWHRVAWAALLEIATREFRNIFGEHVLLATVATNRPFGQRPRNGWFDVGKPSGQSRRVLKNVEWMFVIFACSLRAATHAEIVLH